MFKIVDGVAYASKPAADRYMVTTVDLGNGHFEGAIQRCHDWHEIGGPVLDVLGNPLEPKWTDEDEDEKRLANLKRAARRAKTKVRRLVKAQGLDTLLTLTYKANQTDLELCKRHVELMRKRLARLLGGFCFVVCYEPQARGAWHAHLAVHKLPPTLEWGTAAKVKSFNVIRAIWRDVAGEHGGNIDVGRKKRNSKKSPARCAAYISKYILKAFEDGAEFSNRYSASRCALPKPVRNQFEGVQLRELVAMLVDVIGDKRSLATVWVSPFGDTVFIAGEKPS